MSKADTCEQVLDFIKALAADLKFDVGDTRRLEKVLVPHWNTLASPGREKAAVIQAAEAFAALHYVFKGTGK